MCKLTVLAATKTLYKGPRGGIYWQDEKGKKHYVKETSTEAKPALASKEDKPDDNTGRVCSSCGKTLKATEEAICDECWFIEQTKLKGGQYL